MKAPTLALIILLFCATTGAAQQSDAADALSRLNQMVTTLHEDLTPQDGYYLGRAAAAMIIQRWRLYTENPALTTYLNLICMALAVNSPAPDWFNGYHLAVLDSPVPNAFSTSSGHIFVTRGMVALATSEDMLAAVIAHELAHVQLAHGIQGVNHARLVRSLQEEGARAAASAERDAAAVERRRVELQVIATEMIHTLLDQGYSQTQELEADSLALELLAAAGYAPASLIEILRILERTQPRQEGIFGTTHPIPALRIDNAERKARTYRVPDTRSYRRARFERMVRN